MPRLFPLAGLLLLAALALGRLARANDHPLLIGPPVQPISVVHSLDQLRHQPLLRAGPGTTVRLGLQSLNCSDFSGVLVYCLVEAAAPDPFHDQQQLDPAERWLGPLRIAVPNPPDFGQPEPDQSGDDQPSLPAPTVGAGRLYVFPVVCVGQHELPITLLAPDGTPLAKANILCDGQAALPWYAFNAQTTNHGAPGPLTPATGLRVLPIWAFHDGIPSTPALPQFEPTAPDPTFVLTRTDHGCRLASPHPFNAAPRARFIAHWWVNGEPVQVRSTGGVAPTAADSADETAVTTLNLDFALNPADLNAADGDQITLQLLYVEGGWESVGSSEGSPAINQSAFTPANDPHNPASAPRPYIRLSNKISWTLHAAASAEPAPAPPSHPTINPPAMGPVMRL